MRNISVNKKYLFGCIAISLMLCAAQVVGNTLLVSGSLLLYMLLLAWCCSYDFTLPILLFFLPWSPIMRLNPDSFSVYTFGLVMICVFSVVKKRLSMRKYQLITCIILMALSLLSKLLDGSDLSFAYVAFMMMIALFPSVREESYKQKYDFYQLVLFFSLGAIIAALCAMYFAEYSNIGQFIRVDEYNVVIRRCGFYGDPNFYVAQILAALGGALALILHEKMRKKVVFLVIIALLLLYCGFLSGSKSFALVLAAIVLLWIIAIWKMRGKAGVKIVLLLLFAGVVAYIATSEAFGQLIQVVTARFSVTSDFDSFTTGRASLWKSYLDEIFGNVKVLFLGEGLTNVKVNERGSHSTVIQIFYQFGLLGAPVLFYWSYCFFKSNAHMYKKQKDFRLHKWMVFVGVFVPWLAIDMLFFDEFFLLPWFTMAALEQFSSQPPMQRVVEEHTIDST